MITTDDGALAARMRRLRHHGIAQSGEPADEIGWNYRMTDVQAAIGLVQLGRLDGLLARRRALAAKYAAALAGTPVAAPLVPDDRDHTFQSYQVLLDGAAARDAALARLAADGIAAQRGVMLIHRAPPYAAARGPVPGAEQAFDRALILPMFHALTDEDQARVVARLLNEVANVDGGSQDFC
jgi:perosamine synthetase